MMKYLAVLFVTLVVLVLVPAFSVTWLPTRMGLCDARPQDRGTRPRNREQNQRCRPAGGRIRPAPCRTC